MYIIFTYIYSNYLGHFLENCYFYFVKLFSCELNSARITSTWVKKGSLLLLSLISSKELYANSRTSMWWAYNTGYHCRFAPLRSPEQQKIRTSRLHTSSSPLPSISLPEQPAASGQQPPNCWGEGVLPYLIALDDVIDLPQVVAATCFVADLQQHQAYFLLSQFSRSYSTLPFSLKYTEWETEMGKGGNGRGNTKIEKNTERGKERGNRNRDHVSLYLNTTSGWESIFKFREDFGIKFVICYTQEN